MEKADIFIGTSDSREGWGVVVNEAMNAGCAVVANKKMGSAPILIKHNNNGFLYKNYNELEEYVKILINNEELRRKMSINAYNYITTEWTSNIAAENIISLFNSIINNKDNTIKEGPASKA